MLQEEGQTVGFDPAYVCYVHHPWYVNLFILYLFLVPPLAIVRSVRLAWLLRSQKATRQAPDSPAQMVSQDRWQLACVRARSFRNLSHLTVLLSVLVLTLSLCRAFDAVIAQKVAGAEAIAGSAADALTIFSRGLLVASGLFCAAVFFEGLIRRRKSSNDREFHVP
jgi:hypothetical protein